MYTNCGISSYGFRFNTCKDPNQPQTSFDVGEIRKTKFYPCYDSNYDSKLYTPTDGSDKILTRKEAISMSFVGIVRCEDGVVGFADSKCTHMDIFGGMGQNSKRLTANKIFDTKNFIMVTFGLNQIHKGNSYENLGDYIEPHLKRFERPIDFCEWFSWELKNFQYSQTFDFLFGTKNGEILHYTVNELGVGCIYKSNLLGHKTNPIAIYYDLFSSDISAIYLDTKTVTKFIHNKIPKYIQIIDDDELIFYNPVGGKIHTRVLLFDK